MVPRLKAIQVKQNTTVIFNNHEHLLSTKSILPWLLYKNTIIEIVSLPLSLQSKMKYNNNAVSRPQNFLNLETALLANKRGKMIYHQLQC